MKAPIVPAVELIPVDQVEVVNPRLRNSVCSRRLLATSPNWA
jgi:hypothetical protein